MIASVSSWVLVVVKASGWTHPATSWGWVRQRPTGWFAGSGWSSRSWPDCGRTEL